MRAGGPTQGYPPDFLWCPGDCWRRGGNRSCASAYVAYKCLSEGYYPKTNLQLYSISILAKSSMPFRQESVSKKGSFWCKTSSAPMGHGTHPSAPSGYDGFGTLVRLNRSITQRTRWTFSSPICIK